MAEPKTIAPTDLHRALGISVGHASNILSGKRAPSRELALRIWREVGVKTGPLASLSDTDVRAIARIEARAA